MLPSIRRGGGGGKSSSASNSESTLNAVLGSLPAQPEVQLDVGLEILRRAFTQRVKELDDENKEVRQLGKEKMQMASVLEQKVAALEKAMDDMSNQACELSVEHQTLTSERDALAGQYKKISHNVKALVAFKKNCSAFLDHKDDFDVDTIHDSLPQHLRDMVMDEPPPRRKGSRGTSSARSQGHQGSAHSEGSVQSQGQQPVQPTEARHSSRSSNRRGLHERDAADDDALAAGLDELLQQQ